MRLISTILLCLFLTGPAFNQEASRDSAAVEIKSEPSGARVSIDGEYHGNTTLRTKLPYGRHIIKLSSPIFFDLIDTVNIERPHFNKTYDMKQVTIPIEISGIPQGAEIRYKDRTRIHSADPARISLPYGENEIKIKLDGYENLIQRINMKPGAPTDIQVKMYKKSTSIALVQSFFVPGLGQSYQGKRLRRWLYPALIAGAAIPAYLHAKDHKDAVFEYNTIREQYLDALDEEEIVRTRAAMAALYDDLQSSREARNAWLAAMGAIWLWNALDTVIFAPKYRDVELSTAMIDDGIVVGMKLNLR